MACQRVAKQRGYQRAIRGFLEACEQPHDYISRLPVNCARYLEHEHVAPVVELNDSELLAQIT